MFSTSKLFSVILFTVFVSRIRTMFKVSQWQIVPIASIFRVFEFRYLSWKKLTYKRQHPRLQLQPIELVYFSGEALIGFASCTRMAICENCILHLNLSINISSGSCSERLLFKPWVFAQLQNNFRELEDAKMVILLVCNDVQAICFHTIHQLENL